MWIIFYFCKGDAEVAYELRRQGPVSRKFRTRKAICQTAIYMFWKAVFLNVFSRIVKFGGLEHKGNCGTRNRLKSFGTFEKQALGSWDVLTPKTHCMLWPPHDQVLTPFLRPYWMNEGKKFVLFLSHSESLKEPVTVLGTRIPNPSILALHFLLIFFLWFLIGQFYSHTFLLFWTAVKSWARFKEHGV